jgi:hypothetical protein
VRERRKQENDEKVNVKGLQREGGEGKTRRNVTSFNAKEAKERPGGTSTSFKSGGVEGAKLKKEKRPVPPSRPSPPSR